MPDHWSCFESIDFGHSNPTAYLVWLADEDGNLVIVDEYYSPGLASEHAPQILGRRKRWRLQGYPYCYSDPRRPRPATADPGEPDDWKAWKQAELLRRHDERVGNPRRRFELV